MKVAFVIHLYYISMLDELCGHLDKLCKHVDFDVFVTTQAGVDTKLIADRLQAKEVEIVENRGRDVLPFLKMLPKLKGYDYVCKLHTKQDYEWRGPSSYLHDRGWRENMWLSLTDPVLVEKAKEALDDGQGFYAPEGLWFKHWNGENFENNLANMRVLGDLLGVSLFPQSFVAGTMFWFRPEALMWLTEFDLDGLFEPEEGADDGKMEHAFERSFHQLARKA
jgi:lipopolysaccharide biosynthesis protein